MKMIVVFILCALSAFTADAVIYAGGDGADNISAPSDDPGWANVGSIDTADSSVTYLGNDWFITAYHVQYYDAPSAVDLNESSYSIDSSRWTRITNSTGSNTDLVLFKSSSAVSGVSSVTLSSSSPSAGTDLVMIGNGRNRESSLTTWYVDVTPDDWIWGTSSFAGADASVQGYEYASGSSMRWGENTVEGTVANVDDGFGETDMFYTDFDAVVGETQAATYDSGGAVFSQNGEDWELSGIMLTVGSYSNQPSDTAIFGNTTYMADLSVYADQINDTIPEPSTALLLVGFAGLFGLAYRIRCLFD